MRNALHELLSNQNSNLGKILARANQLQLLNKQLSDYLSSEFLGRCTVANIRNNSLIIQANNAIIATQLRFQSGDLLEYFRNKANLRNLCSIQVIVRPDYNAS
ncbi:MAG: DciA family protein [Gammaproteobacteria bacterium]